MAPSYTDVETEKYPGRVHAAIEVQALPAAESAS
jgi:hypothetical protein